MSERGRAPALLCNWPALHAGSGRTALVSGAWRATYAELDVRGRRLAAGLRQEYGVRPGDRLAVLAANSIEYIELLAACARLGAVAVPVDPCLPPPAQAFRVLDSGAGLLFAGTECARLVPQATHGTAVRETLRLGPGGETEGLIDACASDGDAPAGGPDAPFIVVYSGDPPAALAHADRYAGDPPAAPAHADRCVGDRPTVLTHADLYASAQSSAAALGLRAGEVGLSLLSLAEPGGLALLVAPLLLLGGTAVLPRAADAVGTLALLREQRAGVLLAPSELLAALPAAPGWAELAGLRVACAAGAPLDPALVQRYAERGIDLFMAKESADGCVAPEPAGPFPNGPLRIPSALWQRVLAHALAARPQEACGLLSGSAGAVAGFYPTRNAHATPVTRYSIDPRELLRVLQGIERSGQELLAIFHTHPATPAYPSQTDVDQAHYPEALYLICSLADPEQPVLRGFWLRDGSVREHPVQVGG